MTNPENTTSKTVQFDLYRLVKERVQLALQTQYEQIMVCSVLPDNEENAKSFLFSLLTWIGWISQIGQHKLLHPTVVDMIFENTFADQMVLDSVLDLVYKVRTQIEITERSLKADIMPPDWSLEEDLMDLVAQTCTISEGVMDKEGLFPAAIHQQLIFDRAGYDSPQQWLKDHRFYFYIVLICLFLDYEWVRKHLSELNQWFQKTHPNEPKENTNMVN